MRFNKLDLNQLALLDTILSTRSVSRTAEQLRLSQPAVSCALKRLRDYFEDELLVLVGKTYVLTSLGVELSDPVRDVLLKIQAITRTRAEFDPKTSTRKITIESSDYIASILLPEILRRVGSQAPLMQFDLRPLSPRTSENLENGEVALVITPELFNKHPHEILFEDGFSCISWNDGIDSEAWITESDYFERVHVAIEWEGGRITTLDARAIASAGHRRNELIVSPGFTLVPAYIERTSRIATLPTRLARQMATRFPLRVMPCPIPTPKFTEHIQWHKYQEHDPAILWLRDIFQDVARNIDEIF